MRSREIARRYAEALYELSSEEGCVERIDNDYRHVIEEMKPVPDLSRFLMHPLVPRSDKISLLEKAFPDISEYLQKMFSILICNGREGYFEMIYEEFERSRTSSEGTIQVKVTTAQDLSPSDRKHLSEHIAARIGSRVELIEDIDKDLIGGLRIELNGKVLDGSLRARLRKLKTVLEG